MRRYRFTALAIVALLCPLAGGAEVYVSPDGDDAWSGALPQANETRSDGPVASLERARTLVRQHISEGDGSQPVTVYLRGGLYELDSPFLLAREDSGLPNRPVIWSSMPGETVRLSGGRRVGPLSPVIDPEVLKRLPVEARPHVLQADLTQRGLKDFGEAAQPGLQSELFYRHQPMRLARWPNEGFTQIREILNIEPFTSHGIAGDKQGRFVYEGDRPGRWLAELEAWLSGYWFWDWSDQNQQIASIDLQTNTLALKPPFHHYGFRQGQRYYAFNLLAELDSPGEWYLDRQRGLLYLWPPGPVNEDGQDIEFSVLPSLISLQQVSHLTLRGLLLENCRGTAITIEDGNRVLVTGCHIRNTGGWAVQVSGQGCGVRGSEIHHTGQGGVSLVGGDRATLTAAELFAENNHIHHFARLVRTYQPAVNVSGVGHRVAHNLIHDAPHNAIQLSGNEHLIEMNEVHHVCQETGDVGAFYMGRDWTMRGNVIRHNYFHHIQGPGLHGAMAVYLDDAASGTTITGNLFWQASRAAFIGGGRDNRVENNIFIECQPSVHLDARGLGWMHETVEPGGIMPQRLEQVPYRQPPWSERYPELVNILDEQPAAPKGNIVLRNISVGGRWKDVEAKAEPGIVFESNLVDIDPRFVDAAQANFRLREDSPAWDIGFQPSREARLLGSRCSTAHSHRPQGPDIESSPLLKVESSSWIDSQR